MEHIVHGPQATERGDTPANLECAG